MRPVTAVLLFLLPGCALAAKAAAAAPPKAVAGAPSETPAEAARRWPGVVFSSSAAQIVAECRLAVGRADMALEAAVRISDAARAFSNTPEVIENALAELAEAVAAPALLGEVSPRAELRLAGKACADLARRFEERTFARHDLLSALSAYAARKEPLGAEERRLVESLVSGLKRGGAGLGGRDRERLLALREELRGVERAFLANLDDADATEHLLLAPDELEGLGPRAGADASAPEAPGAPPLLSAEALEGAMTDWIGPFPRHGERYRAGASDEQYLAGASRARRPATRRLLESLHGQRASKTNPPLLERMLDLRRDSARSLGYRDHARFALEDHALATPSRVEGFLDALAGGLHPAGRAELSALRKLKDSEEGPDSDGAIHAWDLPYYGSILIAQSVGATVDQPQDAVPLDAAVDGMLGLARRLYGLEFREVSPSRGWEPGVRLLAARDAWARPESPGRGDDLGFVFLDLAAPAGSLGIDLDGGRRAALARPLARPRLLPDGSRRPAVSAVVGAPADARTGRAPRAVSPDQLDALLRAFGTALHWTMSKTRFARFSAAEAAPDFAGAPGVVFERWAWTDQGLPCLTRELAERRRASQNAEAALVWLGRVSRALYDLFLHAAGITDLAGEYATLAAKVGLVPVSRETRPEAALRGVAEHGMGLYAPIWSRVLGLDLFSRFEKGGFLDPSMGRRFRELVLEPGASRDPNALVEDFLGRKPSQRAFLEDIGAIRPKKR